MAIDRRETLQWIAIAVVASVAWAIFLSISGPSAGLDGLSPPRLEGSGLARPADFAWPLLDLDEKPVDFARYRGKPILLNIWATWCGPCVKEMPSIASLARNPRLKDKGIVFLCVSTDQSAPMLRDFVQAHPSTLTILRATSLPPSFSTEGIPATFLIAPDGRIVASEVGAARWDDASVVDLLEKLAKPAS